MDTISSLSNSRQARRTSLYPKLRLRISLLTLQCNFILALSSPALVSLNRLSSSFQTLLLSREHEHDGHRMHRLFQPFLSLASEENGEERDGAIGFVLVFPFASGMSFVSDSAVFLDLGWALSFLLGISGCLGDGGWCDGGYECRNESV